MTQHYQGKRQSQARTVTELVPVIGQYVYVRFESVSVGCFVKDAKQSYGKVRLLISPADGSGEQWIELERLVESHGVRSATYTNRDRTSASDFPFCPECDKPMHGAIQNYCRCNRKEIS